MSKLKIAFCHNWNNKLDCQAFTTIRKYSSDKHHFYHSAIGKEFEIVLNKTPYSAAELDAVKVWSYKNIPHAMLSVDTGTDIYNPIFRKFGIMPDDAVIVLSFVKNAKLSNATGIRKDSALAKGRRPQPPASLPSIRAWYGTGCLLTSEPIPDITQTVDKDSAAYYGGVNFVCETINRKAAMAIAQAMGWTWTEPLPF